MPPAGAPTDGAQPTALREAEQGAGMAGDLYVADVDPGAEGALVDVEDFEDLAPITSDAKGMMQGVRRNESLRGVGVGLRFDAIVVLGRSGEAVTQLEVRELVRDGASELGGRQVPGRADRPAVEIAVAHDPVRKNTDSQIHVKPVQLDQQPTHGNPLSAIGGDGT